MTDISPLTQNFPIVDKDGYYTSSFARWLALVLARIGGVTGGSYSALPNPIGSIIWDLNASPMAAVKLVNGVNTMNPPLNLVAGLHYHLTIIQPSSGAAGTISWPNPPVKFPGGATPTLSTGNNAVDILEFFCDGTNLYLIIQGLNYS